MFDTSLKREWDNKAVLDYAVNEAVKEATKEAEHNKAVDIAREMKQDGIPVDQIAKFTKLSIAEIEKL